nr:hypothetical protein [bacterium]
MKHYLSLLLTLLVTIPLLAMEYHYQVPTPLVSPDGQVTAAGMFTGGQPGAPAVPVFPVRILLPPGSAASQVTIDYGQRMDLGVVLLPPVQQQWPFSLSEQATITRRDSLVWAQPYDLPLTELDHISTQQLAGYSILYVETHPVRYNPLTRRLSFYCDFDLRVETIPAECRFTPVAAARSRVSGLVDNPEDLLAYVVPATRTEAYDYLIVTSNELQEDFQPLADWRNSIGIRTRIVTIEDIVPFWDGVDNAARLRNFLINEYQQWGIKYLLLAGDTDQLPYRRLYVLAGSTEDHLPSDLYFAGLDGTWNNDGDDRWGEPGEEDWLQEIVVGRASVSNSSEATNFVNKQLGYQQAPVVADLLAYLMVGENLDEVPTWGGDCKDEIRYGSSLHGITTAGLAPQINSSLLYDRESYWSTSDLFERLSQGINLTNHLGHSNHSYMMRMNLDDVNTINLTADGISHNFHVGYSQGCIPGAFEENDCIIEELTNLPTGYAAFIGNSRYGWYQPGGTGGSSQLFDREFFDAIFGEEIGTLGEALQDSRDDLISQTMNDGHMRWVFYELNLFGDPAMYAWTLEPQVIAAQYNDSLEVGSTTLAVEVTSGGQPGRGMLAAVVSDGVYYGGGTTDNSGQLLIEFTAPLVQIGEYELVISGWNCLPASLPLVVAPAQGPFLILTDSEFTDSAGNGNGLPEAGEELELTISLANAGIEVASGVNALLSCASEYIEVSLPAVTLPDIPSGGEMTAAVPFQLVAAASTPDLLEVECVLTIWCDGGAWTESIPLALHAPQVTIIEMTADPDGNGILDPGETTWLEMTLINTGSGWVTDLAALLETVDDCITFVQAADNMDELMPGSTGELAFQLTTAEDTEPGHTVAFSLLLTGQPGLELTLDFLLVVGQHLEGFETGDFSTCDWTPGGDAPWTIVEE